MARDIQDPLNGPSKWFQPQTLRRRHGPRYLNFRHDPELTIPPLLSDPPQSPAFTVQTFANGAEVHIAGSTVYSAFRTSSFKVDGTVVASGVTLSNLLVLIDTQRRLTVVAVNDDSTFSFSAIAQLPNLPGMASSVEEAYDKDLLAVSVTGNIAVNFKDCVLLYEVQWYTDSPKITYLGWTNLASRDARVACGLTRGELWIAHDSYGYTILRFLYLSIPKPLPTKFCNDSSDFCTCERARTVSSYRAEPRRPKLIPLAFEDKVLLLLARPVIAGRRTANPHISPRIVYIENAGAVKSFFLARGGTELYMGSENNVHRADLKNNHAPILSSLPGKHWYVDRNGIPRSLNDYQVTDMAVDEAQKNRHRLCSHVHLLLQRGPNIVRVHPPHEACVVGEIEETASRASISQFQRVIWISTLRLVLFVSSRGTQVFRYTPTSLDQVEIRDLADIDVMAAGVVRNGALLLVVGRNKVFAVSTSTLEVVNSSLVRGTCTSASVDASQAIAIVDGGRELVRITPDLHIVTALKDLPFHAYCKADGSGNYVVCGGVYSFFTDLGILKRERLKFDRPKVADCICSPFLTAMVSPEGSYYFLVDNGYQCLYASLRGSSSIVGVLHDESTSTRPSMVVINSGALFMVKPMDMNDSDFTMLLRLPMPHRTVYGAVVIDNKYVLAITDIGLLVFLPFLGAQEQDTSTYSVENAVSAITSQDSPESLRPRQRLLSLHVQHQGNVLLQFGATFVPYAYDATTLQSLNIERNYTERASLGEAVWKYTAEDGSEQEELLKTTARGIMRLKLCKDLDGEAKLELIEEVTTDEVPNAPRYISTCSRRVFYGGPGWLCLATYKNGNKLRVKRVVKLSEHWGRRDSQFWSITPFAERLYVVQTKDVIEIAQLNFTQPGLFDFQGMARYVYHPRVRSNFPPLPVFGEHDGVNYVVFAVVGGIRVLSYDTKIATEQKMHFFTCYLTGMEQDREQPLTAGMIVRKLMNYPTRYGIRVLALLEDSSIVSFVA